MGGLQHRRFFGAQLKFAGYDGIVITGASNSPAYIYIEDAKVEIRDARKYWGKDVYAVNDEMIADHKTESKKNRSGLCNRPCRRESCKICIHHQ